MGAYQNLLEQEREFDDVQGYGPLAFHVPGWLKEKRPSCRVEFEFILRSQDSSTSQANLTLVKDSSLTGGDVGEGCLKNHMGTLVLQGGNRSPLWSSFVPDFDLGTQGR